MPVLRAPPRGWGVEAGDEEVEGDPPTEGLDG